MNLICTQCGGTVSPDGEALRRRFATCRHCSTVLHLGPEGLVVHDGEPPGEPPPGVRVDERPGRLALTAPWAQVVVGRRELIVGGGVAAVGLVAVTLAFDVMAGVLAGLGAGIAATFGLAALRRGLPPVVLTDDALLAGHGMSPPVPRDRIRQLFVTETTFVVQDQRTQTIHLVALTTDDQRVQLAGPFRDVAEAVWIEETLEGRLGLLDRGVRGPADDFAPEAPLALPEACASCGTSLPATELDRRGFVVCPSCDGLVLAWAPGEGPLVGDPGWQAVRVEETDDAIVMTLKEGLDRLERTLAGGTGGTRVHVTAEGLSVDGTRLPSDDVERVRVVQRKGSFVEGIGAFTRATHHGGEANLGQLLHEGLRFDVVVDGSSGTTTVFAGLVDVREADRLRARLGRRLER